MESNEYLECFFSTRQSNFVSKIIAYFQEGVSHTGFKFYLPQLDKQWIWESKGHGGLSYSDPMEFYENVTVIELYQIKWTEDERIRCLRSMDKLLRETYGFLGMIGMTAVLAVKKFGGWTDNPFPWGFLCSKAVYKILKEEFRFYVDGDPNENRVGPDDLRDMFRQLVVKYPERIVRLK